MNHVELNLSKTFKIDQIKFEENSHLILNVFPPVFLPKIIYIATSYSSGVCVCVCVVCVRVCMCVCVCVCECVFIFFHREGFFRLQDIQDIPEGTDQRSCVVNIS